MRIKIVAVGKLKDRSLQALCADFYDRLKHYTPIELIEVKEEKLTAALPRDEALKREGNRLSKEIQPGCLMTLEVAGRQFDSIELARFLQTLQNRGQKELHLVIGGPLGLGPDITGPATWRWSLSKLTFPHEMARYIALEQLYRAFTILKGEHYHK
jgi:23S rRNA (pseudouridine1915-N3)-methyltransferase